MKSKKTIFIILISLLFLLGVPIYLYKSALPFGIVEHKAFDDSQTTISLYHRSEYRESDMVYYQLNDKTNPIGEIQSISDEKVLIKSKNSPSNGHSVSIDQIHGKITYRVPSWLNLAFQLPIGYAVIILYLGIAWIKEIHSVFSQKQRKVGD